MIIILGREMGVYHHLRNRRFFFRNHHFYSSQVKLREGGSPLRLEIVQSWSLEHREKAECHTVFFGWGWKLKSQISRSCNQKHSKIEDLITLKRCFVSQLVQDSWNTPSHPHYQILIYKQFTSCLPPASSVFLLLTYDISSKQQKQNQELPPYFKTTPQHVVFSWH